MVKTKKVLICWIGGNDLLAVGRPELGPILSTLKEFEFDSVELLYNYKPFAVEGYLKFVSSKTRVSINAHHEKLSSPIDFEDIYQASKKHLSRLANEEADVSILLSPGTPAMQAVWILLSKTRYKTKFLQASVEEGVRVVDIPFEISAEYSSPVNKLSSESLSNLASHQIPSHVAFGDILTRNEKMKKVIWQAEILAQKDVPILIDGETGTGKELFARAIHNASRRAAKPFVAINCGAIPNDLIDSILFGHTRGAFTGAINDKLGVFQQAHGGTLFLDEFGELSLDVQVRLLRVLQEGTFTPIGATREIKCDVRIITATHRNLIEAVSQGLFREDLFYRVAVGVIHLPSLREREGDISLLTDAILKQICDKDENLKHKYISVGARNIILNHGWKGNVRELQSSLTRAAIWSQHAEISEEDMRQSLFYIPKKSNSYDMEDLNQGIDLYKIIGDLSSRYIREALRISNQNKTRAAELLSLKNYQTLNNWMKKYNIK